jgi:hypothetical protein
VLSARFLPGARYRARVGDRAGRRAARERVAAYHQACLDELVRHVASAIDGWRAGSLDAHDVDEVLHHYQRAARELWKFCWSTGGGSQVELIASHIRQLAEDDQVIDWWDVARRVAAPPAVESSPKIRADPGPDR